MTIKLLKICSRTIKNLPKKIRSNAIICVMFLSNKQFNHNKRPLAQNTKRSLMVIKPSILFNIFLYQLLVFFFPTLLPNLSPTWGRFDKKSLSVKRKTKKHPRRDAFSVHIFSNPVATRLDSRPSEDQSWQFHDYYTERYTNYYNKKTKRTAKVLFVGS